jgi:hypothetical protein
MTELENTLEEAAISILDQYPGILDQSQDIDQYSGYQLNRGLLKADNEIWYDKFYSYIIGSVDYHKNRNDLKIDVKLLNYFQDRFKDAFAQLKRFLKNNGVNAYRRFYNDKLYFDYLDELLYLGIWDDDFTNDPYGKLSPFGPLLILLHKYRGERRIGILHAIKQQSAHFYNDNQAKAQELANKIYNHFLDFASSNDLLKNLSPGYKHPPIIQLCAGGAATLLGGLPVPAIIAIDKIKADKFSGFSALPHECGHDLSGTFKKKMLVNEIITPIKKLQLPYGEFWIKWIEECLADAIGVAIIKEGEIFSLANLFSNYYTNRIFKDSTGKNVDEHPVPHIRVLLTIEVGRILGIDRYLLQKTKEEWIAYGKKINTDIPSDKIKNLFNDKIYPMKKFVEGIEPVAKALVDTPYNQINGKKVKDIFADFESELADELRTSIIEKKWL